jgi:hypothetical protein
MTIANSFRLNSLPPWGLQPCVSLYTCYISLVALMSLFLAIHAEAMEDRLMKLEALFKRVRRQPPGLKQALTLLVFAASPRA